MIVPRTDKQAFLNFTELKSNETTSKGIRKMLVSNRKNYFTVFIINVGKILIDQQNCLNNKYISMERQVFVQE